MKKCRNCGIEKDDSEFYKSSHHKDGLSTLCNVCSREKNRLDREKHKASRTEKDRVRMAEFRKNNRDSYLKTANDHYKRNRQLLESLKQPCVKCGENRLYVVDFHHINHENKSFNLTSCGSHSKESLQIEAAKCVCLCRNCHQEFHHFYGCTPEHPVEALTEYLGRNPYEI